MADHGLAHLAEVWRISRLPSGEHVGEVTEEPGTTQAPSTDHDAVATGRTHHPNGVIGCPDVTIPENRDRLDRFPEAGDGGPIRFARIELTRGAGVQSHRSRTLFLGDEATGRIETAESALCPGAYCCSSLLAALRSRGLEILADRDHVPWVLREHDRWYRVFHDHCILARRSDG